MTIGEVENITGLDRANIRFYEKEGLLSPLRGGNGYRDYSRADVDTLLKIKLLRSLGISLAQIKSLEAGELSLAAALGDRIENNAHERYRLQVSDMVCRSLEVNHEDYSTLDPQPYLRQLSADPAAAVPREDSVSVQNIGPWRRYFARMLDISIYTVIWYVFLELVLRVSVFSRQVIWEYVDTFIAFGFMLFIEPLMLKLWGTTPGKWILGIRVYAVSSGGSRRLTYAEGLRRTWGVIVRGLGFNVPIYSIWRLWQSRKAVLAGEELPWDEECVVSPLDSRRWRVAAYLGAALVLGFALSITVLRSQMPRHRGAITQEEFVENFNDLAKYFDCQLGGTLLTDGTWRMDKTYLGNSQITVSDSAGEPVIVTGDDGGYTPSPLPQLSFKTLDGELVGVSFDYNVSGSAFVGILDIMQMMQISAGAFVGAQPEVRVISDDMAIIMENSALNSLEGFSYEMAGVTVACDIDNSGYDLIVSTLMPTAELSSLSLSFSMEKNVL